jgi:hypothetical protein
MNKLWTTVLIDAKNGEKAGFESLGIGISWMVTLLRWVKQVSGVHYPAVIPPSLTSGIEKSFPDAFFFHSGGKAAKRPIKYRKWVVS